MGRILKLDTKVANLIAAGEVIERVASVVKELVENSIDALATNIKVELVESGLKEIIVSDNGIGMDVIDAKCCVLPHYTSKIKNSDDLFNINTLGFRGEALPSICAVSNLTIKTSTVDGKGISLRFKDEKLVAEGTISLPKGTTISVKDLFYNTPARLAQLSNANNEVSFVSDYLTKIAFAYPDIAFLFIANGRTIFQTYGNDDQLEVISSVYGFDVARNMLAFAKESNYFSVEGYTSKINVTRSSKQHITILVNGRLIRNYNITNAIIKGYGTRLMVGKYPITIIQITCDAGLVDVNVHPAKAEVRFSMEEELDELVKDAISEILDNNSLIVEQKEINDLADSDPFLEEIDIDEQDSDDEDSDISFDFDKEIVVSEAPSIIFSEEDADPFEENIEPSAPVYEELKLFSDGIALSSIDNENKLPLMNYVGQLFETYILAQGEENFYLIDQHAAAERINYEQIYDKLSNDKILSYELLVPISYTFTPSEALIIEAKIEELKELGIEIENFGGTTYVVRSIGTWIPKSKINDYLEEIFNSLIRGTKTKKEEFLDSLAKSLACKAAIKGNEYHSEEEARMLLNLLNKTKNPYTCPHGRPVIVKFTKNEIEKWFKRIV